MASPIADRNAIHQTVIARLYITMYVSSDLNTIALISPAGASELEVISTVPELIVRANTPARLPTTHKPTISEITGQAIICFIVCSGCPAALTTCTPTLSAFQRSMYQNTIPPATITAAKLIKRSTSLCIELQ